MYRHVWVYWKHSNYNYKQHTHTHTVASTGTAYKAHCELWGLRKETPSPKTCRAWPRPSAYPYPRLVSAPSPARSRPCVCRRCWSCTYCALAIYYVLFVVVVVAVVVYGPVQKRFCALFTCAPGGNSGALSEHVWLIRFHKTQLNSRLSSARLVLIHSFNKPLANSAQSGNATRKESACV